MSLLTDEEVKEIRLSVPAVCTHADLIRHTEKFIEAKFEQGKRDAIPDGCVLVPKEYCREIGDAASEYFESFGKDFKVRTPGTFLFSKLWEAMLAAAPKQEK